MTNLNKNALLTLLKIKIILSSYCILPHMTMIFHNFPPKVSNLAIDLKSSIFGTRVKDFMVCY